MLDAIDTNQLGVLQLMIDTGMDVNCESGSASVTLWFNIYATHGLRGGCQSVVGQNIYFNARHNIVVHHDEDTSHHITSSRRVSI